MAEADILKIQKSWYLANGSSDRHDIRRGYAFWLSEQIKIKNVELKTAVYTLYTQDTATDRKPQKSYRKAMLTSYHTILYSSRSAWIDPKVKRSKVKVARLRKLSRSHAAAACGWRRVQDGRAPTTVIHLPSCFIAK